MIEITLIDHFSCRCAGFELSEEASVCKALISAYESGDNTQFQQVLQRPILKTMDNEVCLMKRIVCLVCMSLQYIHMNNVFY